MNVILGRLAEPGPEPINTDRGRRALAPVQSFTGAVFIGSGLVGLARAPE
jgi:hypothetical protein